MNKENRKIEKATIEVREVAWSNGEVMKYQAFGRYGGKCVIGDPMPTEEEAFQSLGDEIALWSASVFEIQALYFKQYNK